LYHLYHLCLLYRCVTSCIKMGDFLGAPIIANTNVTIQVSFLLRRLRRRGEGERQGRPAPHQGALQAPWNPLLNSYIQTLNGPFLHMYPGET